MATDLSEVKAMLESVKKDVQEVRECQTNLRKEFETFQTNNQLQLRSIQLEMQEIRNLQTNVRHQFTKLESSQTNIQLQLRWDLKKDVNTAVDRINTTVKVVNEAVDGINTAVDDLSNTVDHLSAAQKKKQSAPNGKRPISPLRVMKLAKAFSRHMLEMVEQRRKVRSPRGRSRKRLHE